MPNMLVAESFHREPSEIIIFDVSTIIVVKANERCKSIAPPSVNSTLFTIRADF